MIQDKAVIRVGRRHAPLCHLSADGVRSCDGVQRVVMCLSEAGRVRSEVKI